MLEQMSLFVADPMLGLGLPLDVTGTPFQRHVWKPLRDIPAGETASYAEVGQRIGGPAVSHALAGAYAADVLALAIPCQRVVRSDGSLSSYRWGVEHKRESLRREGRV